MLALTSATTLLLAATLAGGAPQGAREEDPARDQQTVSADQAADSADTEAEPLTDEEIAEHERWELRVLTSPYDLAGFYRSGGSRGLYGSSPAGSLSSFYRAAPRTFPGWRMAPPPFVLGARRAPGLDLESWDDDDLPASPGELSLRPYFRESGKDSSEEGSHPRASKARRPVEDSKREQ